MDDSRSHLENLFKRYYDGIATVQERDDLMAYIRSSGNTELLEQFLKDSWSGEDADHKIFTVEKSEEILGSIMRSAGEMQKQKGKVYSLSWLRYAAAAAILLIGFGAWLEFRSSHDKKQIQNTVSKIQDVKPGGPKALLTLSDGSVIELDRVGSGFLVRQGAAEISKTHDGVLVYSTNAREKAGEIRMNKISTPKGGQYEIFLPDGSKVWLNASSSIRFPSVFSDSERKVEITGEAFFEVTKDKSKPFRVRFNKSEVQVLGTSFNIMAYPEEGPSKTTLVEGSVFIRNSNENKQLRPGQQAAVLPNGSITTQYIPVDEAIAWRNGMFYFKNSGIEEVMRQLSRWYDIDVVYQGKVPVRQFTGQVARHVNLSEIVSMLRYAGVNCHIADGKMIVDP